MKTTWTPTGKLSDTRLAHAFAGLVRSRATGVLRVERSKVTKLIYLDDGDIAFATSNEESDRLGSVLTRAGKITQEQLKVAQEKLEPRVSLGRSLISLGFITSNDLLWAANTQIQEIVHSVLNWRDGSYVFDAGPLPDEVVNLRHDGPGAVMRGVLKIDDREWILEQLGGMDVTIQFDEENGVVNESKESPLRYPLVTLSSVSTKIL